MTSRGDSVSGYYPGFAGASGLKVRLNELKGQTISGTCISAGVTYAVSHQLGATPSMVLVTPLLVEGDAVTAISAGIVAEAAASGASSTKFYVIGNKDGIKYRAFLLL